MKAQYQVLTDSPWYNGIVATDGVPSPNYLAKCQFWRHTITANRVIYSRGKGEQKKYLMQVGMGDGITGAWYAWVPCHHVQMVTKE